MIIYRRYIKERIVDIGNKSGSDDKKESTITIDDLPSPNVRWVARRKLQVVSAVLSGHIPLEEILDHYNMTEREFRIWEHGLQRNGRKGLMVTKYQWLRRNNRTEL